MTSPDIVLMTASRYRRSQKMLDFLMARDIPFKHVKLDSPQGANLQEQHQFLTSPGILVNLVLT